MKTNAIREALSRLNVLEPECGLVGPALERLEAMESEGVGGWNAALEAAASATDAAMAAIEAAMPTMEPMARAAAPAFVRMLRDVGSAIRTMRR